MKNFTDIDQDLRPRLSAAGLPATFCVMPWTSLFFSPDGHLMPCCNYDWSERTVLGKHKNFLSAANDSMHVALRQHMANHGMTKSCNRCQMREQNQQLSQRMIQTASVSDQLLADIAAKKHDDQTLQNFKLMHWDIRYDNTCNLACRTCSAGLSSTIAAEEKHKMPFIDKDRWQAELKNEIPNVINAHFAGGEPLLMPGHRQMLRDLLANGKNDALISYNTNLTRLDHRGDDIVELWKQFSNLEIMVSLDHVGDAATYVRHGIDWPKFVSNWHRVIRECPHARIGLVLTWSMYNVLDLVEILDRVKSELDTTGVDINYVGGDMWYPWNLPDQNKMVVRDKMLRWAEEHPFTKISSLLPKLANDLMQPSDVTRLQKFRNHQERLDRLRNTSLAKSLPNLYEVLAMHTTYT